MFCMPLLSDGNLSDREAARVRAAGNVAAWLKTTGYSGVVDTTRTTGGEPVRSTRAFDEPTAASDAEEGALSTIDSDGEDGGCAVLQSDGE